MHYTENLYRLVSVNLFEQIRLSHKSFKLETLKDIRGDIVRFYIPHTHIFVVQSAPKFISQRPYVEIDTQRSHTCSYFHLDLDPHCTSSAVCETAFRLRSHTYIQIQRWARIFRFNYFRQFRFHAQFSSNRMYFSETIRKKFLETFKQRLQRFDSRFEKCFLISNTHLTIDDNKKIKSRIRYYERHVLRVNVKREIDGSMFTLIRNVSKPSLAQAHKRCSKVTPVCTRVNRHRGTHTGKDTCIHARFTIYGEFDSGMYVSRTRLPL